MDEKIKMPDETVDAADKPTVQTQDTASDIPTVSELPAVPETGSTAPPRDAPAHAENTHENSTVLHKAFYIVLHRVIPISFIVTATLVYAILALSALMNSDTTASVISRTVTRFMLGEFTGGAQNVRYTETTKPISLNSAIDENTGSIPPESATQPLESEELTLDSEGIQRAEPDYISEEPDFSISRLDMSSGAADAMGLINETPYEVDLNALASAERAIPTHEELVEKYGEDAPLVLILHTHTTESYADTYDTNFRSQDTERNITAIGEIVADKLTEYGIAVIHCTEVFDYPDFNMAYYSAALCIRKYLEEYSSISYIIDIHRDSILSNEKYVNPVTDINGTSAAQMMFVIGTDYGGSGHTGWRDNLALAARIQKSIYSEYPTIPRDINLRSASFNEQYTAGSLLVEIGSCASTLDEVKTTAKIFAEYLAQDILG